VSRRGRGASRASTPRTGRAGGRGRASGSLTPPADDLAIPVRQTGSVAAPPAVAEGPAAATHVPSPYDAETFFDLSLDLLCIAGTDGRFKKVNPAFERILGWTHDQLLARPFYDLVHPDDLEATKREVAKLAQGIPTISFENRYRCADGSYRSLLWTSQPDPEDGLLYAVGHDVTRKRERDQELLEAKEQAEAAARAKAEFLAVMSHEIRTPMSGIIGMAELALESATDEQLRDRLEVIRQSAESLLLLMHDVLDLSKAEAGRLELVANPFDLRETIGGAIKVFAVEARRKGLELLVWMDPVVPDVVLGDAVRLRQVVLNLVGNALKFTRRGRVTVEVEVDSHHRRAGGQDTVQLHVRVRDTGIGIPEDKREAIFESYTQAEGSTQHRFGGTGLGLAISARLVALMHGRIWVESELGAGSVFHFTVPLEVLDVAPAVARPPSAPPERPAPPQGAATGERGADDEARRALRRNLEEWGVQVVEASTVEAARQAMEAARRAPPAADSRQAVRRSPSEAEPLHILLAEDSMVNQRVTSGLLEALGHTVDGVATGVEAVEAVAAAAQGRYDLVLMDLQMPVMGGLEATSAIREREAVEGGHVPIIALTARAMAEDPARCLAAGMDGYLAKPLRHAELMALTAGLTAGRRTAAGDSWRRHPVPAAGSTGPSMAAPAPPATAIPPPPRTAADESRAVAPPIPAGGPVDWGAALEAVDGDAALLGRVVDATLEEGPTLLQELRRQAERGDTEGLRQAAHKLEGTLRCVRDLGLLALAEDLEARARRGDLAVAKEEIEELAARLEPVLAAFEAWRSGGDSSG
jgi:PAS domain S-box-containing protein